MTANTPTADATPAVIRSRWPAVASLASARALVALLWTTGIMALLSVSTLLVARWRGWQVTEELGVLGFRATQDEVTVNVTVLWIPVGVAVAVVAMAAVLPAILTRPLISNGATRREVALGMLSMCLVMLLYLALLTGVTLAIAGMTQVRNLADQVSLGPGELMVGAALGVLSTMVLALAVVTLFQRWRWWVGTAALVAVVAVPSWVGIDLFAVALTGLGVGWEALRAAVFVAAYWLMIRRLPVP